MTYLLGIPVKILINRHVLMFLRPFLVALHHQFGISCFFLPFYKPQFLLLSLFIYFLWIHLNAFRAIIQECALTSYKIQMDRIACQFCQRISQEFTILSCNHIACAECLWSEVRPTLHSPNAIKCPCGQTTTIQSKSLLASSSVTAHVSRHGSPKRHESALRY